MEPETIYAIIFVVTFALFFVTMFFVARNMTLLMGMQTKPISPDDFFRLVEKEDSPLVFTMKVVFGGYYYFATIRHDQICTRSKAELEFPAKCDIVHIKRV